MFTETESTYEKEINQWHQKMTDSLQAPDGWLALVGLEWLKEGDNRIGSAPEADVHLPESVPSEVGVITIKDGVATLRPTSADLTIDGASPKAGQTYILNAGYTDDQLPPVTIGSVTFFVIERDGTFLLRVRDSKNPARLDFKGRKWFPTNPDYRVKATFTPHASKQPVSVENSQGTISTLQNIGYIDFELLGEKRRLEVFEAGANQVWAIFRDQTSGVTTYGAGRFLYAPLSSDNSVDLDFNRSYHPPCAFTPFAICPYPPRENNLPIPISVGEQFNR